MTLTIYCISCGNHMFHVDGRTARAAGIVSFKCPACGKATSVGVQPTGCIVVKPGYPEVHVSERSEQPFMGCPGPNAYEDEEVSYNKDFGSARLA